MAAETKDVKNDEYYVKLIRSRSTPFQNKLIDIAFKHNAAIVGGFIRDRIANMAPRDIDILVLLNDLPALLDDLKQYNPEYLESEPADIGADPLWQQASHFIKVSDGKSSELLDIHSGNDYSLMSAPDVDVNLLMLFANGTFQLWTGELTDDVYEKKDISITPPEILARAEKRQFVVLESEIQEHDWESIQPRIDTMLKREWTRI